MLRLCWTVKLFIPSGAYFMGGKTENQLIIKLIKLLCLDIPHLS
jgi:hypothetical protein